VRPFRIEETFKTFVAREDIAIILINQHIAEMIRYAVDQHIASIPAVLEIPSKEMPYDPSKACLLTFTGFTSFQPMCMFRTVF